MDWDVSPPPGHIGYCRKGAGVSPESLKRGWVSYVLGRGGEGWLPRCGRTQDKSTEEQGGREDRGAVTFRTETGSSSRPRALVHKESLVQVPRPPLLPRVSLHKPQSPPRPVSVPCRLRVPQKPTPREGLGCRSCPGEVTQLWSLVLGQQRTCQVERGECP